MKININKHGYGLKNVKKLPNLEMTLETGIEFKKK
jgi:hypothetical protein